MSTFSRRLRDLRRSQSLRAAAQLIGIDKETLRRYESGERVPNWDTVLDICDFYNVTPDYFTTEAE